MTQNNLNRRKFFTLIGAGTAALALKPVNVLAEELVQTQEKPATNIKDASKIARSAASMPGKFPGKVIRINNAKAVVNDVPAEKEAYKMIERAMLELTGQKSLKKAWRTFVDPHDRIGLKVNPVAGKTLTTSHAVVQSIVKQLKESGIESKNIIIWDRRGPDLKDTGYIEANYPGIRIMGTEVQDENGSFTDKDGKFFSEKNIDKDWYYWADVEGEYDNETMPYMINGGKYSYFSRTITQEVDKIINIPILKNAGGSITNAMKNLAFGAISNTGRLHTKLWNDTCAEVCAFPPLRDKVVLNITDGLRGCFNGGPAANPQFICNYNTILVSSDPVAMDRIGQDIIAEKRVKEGIQKTVSPAALSFLKMSSDLGLGVCDLEKIDLKIVEMA